MRMSKEMYESLQVKDLKAIADSRDMKIPARTKKERIVEMLLELDHAEDEKVLKERAARRKEEAADSVVRKKEEAAGSAVRKEEGASDSAAERQEKPRYAHGKRSKRGTGKPGNGPEMKKRSAESQETDAGSGQNGTAAEKVIYEEQAEPSAVREPSVVQDTEQEGKSGRKDGVSAATAGRYARHGLVRPDQQIVHKNDINPDLDSGDKAKGILEVLQDGYGFIRSANYMPGDNDVYVAPSQIRRFNLKTGDIVEGGLRVRNQNEKFSALLYVTAINGLSPEEAKRRYNFEDMTPVFPDDRIRLEKAGASVAMRVMDLMCPVGKGQRGMIVSPPKAGKTTLLKEVAKSVKTNNPDIHLIILLIDERPEEVTDIREALEGPNVEVIYSTFDELPDHHKRVAEMTIERAKRLVESKRDVMILLDSITRLTRAYNLTEPSSGRTLSGGLDPVALHMPKRFFGAARNMREGGSLTILATALIETGSKMDDVVYEEFKGTGNMEMILNRKLSERRIFPAVDLAKSGTRRDDLLLTPDERECVATIRKAFIGSKGEEATDSVLDLFSRTRTNGEFVNMVKKHMWSF